MARLRRWLEQGYFRKSMLVQHQATGLRMPIWAATQLRYGSRNTGVVSSPGIQADWTCSPSCLPQPSTPMFMPVLPLYVACIVRS